MHQLLSWKKEISKEILQSVCGSPKPVKTVDIYMQYLQNLTVQRTLFHEITYQDEMLTPLLSSHVNFRYDICSRLVIIAIYMSVCFFNNIGKIVRYTGIFSKN
jgi:hypothetical protein